MLNTSYKSTNTAASSQISPDISDMEVNVPFMRLQMGEEEIEEVIDTLRSGWLTTGPKTKRFEDDFAQAVKGKYAIALNSCTAALHLGVVAMGLKPGQAVLVPSMTFAATAEIIQYMGAIPILVDCDPETGNMSLDDAERKLRQFQDGKFPISFFGEIVGIIPVHVGGFMLDLDAVNDFAKQYDLWVIEDAAHAFPSAWRKNNRSKWQFCGEKSADLTCYSFYANKTITTGEGGMVVTNNKQLAEKIRLLSLHGLSKDAWSRYSENSATWDYQIVTTGYKYNITDIASAIGIHQLLKAEVMRQEREIIAETYLTEFSDIDEISLPPKDENRLHSWHLFPIRLNLENLSIDRSEFINQLKKYKVGCSVHWRPLHLHPFYKQTYNWIESDFPVSTDLWSRLVSIPIFPGMMQEEIVKVIAVIKHICQTNSIAPDIKHKSLAAASFEIGTV